MNKKEKNIIKQLSFTIKELDKEKQNYILGLAEGMVIAKETVGNERKKELQEA